MTNNLRLGIKVEDGETEWYSEDETPAILEQIDWEILPSFATIHYSMLIFLLNTSDISRRFITTQRQ